MRPSNVSIEPDTPRESVPQSNEDLESYIFGNGQAIGLPKKLTFLQQIFSFPAMLASLLVGAVFVSARKFLVDPDIWWHIKVGDTVLATHHWPATDPYSFTVFGQPWLAYEWLGDIVLSFANRVGGLAGLEVLLIVLGSAIMLALYGFATTSSGSSKAGFVASGVLLMPAAVSFSLRPQMLGYLFLILTLAALQRFRQKKYRALWFIPLIMLVWVNTHGSWVIGLGAVFVYWVSGLVEFRIGNLEAKRWTEQERTRIASIFLLSLVALPITPYGTRIALSPFEFAFSLPLNATSIIEWQSMPFDTAIGKVFLVLLLGTILTLVIKYDHVWRLEELALFLFGTMMACLHVRFLMIFVPFFAPLLGAFIAPWMPSYNRREEKFGLNAALMTCVLIAIVHYFPTRADLQQRVAGQFPVAAVEYLLQHPVAEPMYDTYGFGGYLIWSRGPEHRVFIDGRADVYERGGVLGDYLHISRIEPGALSILDSYGVQSCLIKRNESLETLLSASPDWGRVYVDSVSAIFVREKGRSALANGND